MTPSVGGTSNRAIVWGFLESGGGDITGDGLYTAPLTLGTYHLIVTSRADPTKSATATISVENRLLIGPPSATITLGDQVTFSAFAADLTNQSFTWRIVEGDAGGTISPSGLYVAPQTAGVFHILATSSGDPTRSAVATVTVQTGGAEGTIQ